MDYLQYYTNIGKVAKSKSFKPYYKWITFNIMDALGIYIGVISFKPYYKWITFNIAIITSAVAATSKF